MFAGIPGLPFAGSILLPSNASLCERTFPLIRLPVVPVNSTVNAQGEEVCPQTNTRAQELSEGHQSDTFLFF